jgi:hypothetical protein
VTGLAKTIIRQTLNTFDRKDHVRRIRSRYLSSDSWLRHATSIVHVGANTGQEATTYASFDLEVLWIEPIPHVYEQLLANIRAFPKQRVLLRTTVQAAIARRTAVNLLTRDRAWKMAANIACRSCWRSAASCVQIIRRLREQRQPSASYASQADPSWQGRWRRAGVPRGVG